MKRLLCIIVFVIIQASLFANVDKTVGNIRLVIEDYNGSVTIFRKSGNDKFVSLLDSKTFTKSPAFFIFLNGAVLPVNVETGFKITSSFKDDQATLTAVLKNKLELTVVYDLFATKNDGTVDAVKITASIKSLSKSNQEVALKAFFDTMLGENTTTHFSTALRNQITSETQFTNILNEKWIQSASSTDVIRFIIPENQLISIDNITVANKYLLSQLNWIYNVQRGREFHSLNSYNNSALAITWNQFILDEEPYNNVEFYILTGEPSVILPSTWPLVSEPNTTAEVRQQTSTPQTVNAFSHLSPEDLERILIILDTINTLKADNTYLNEQEILSLNAEVDEILENSRR